MNLLTPTDAAVLNAARRVLADLTERAREAGYDAENNRRAAELGRFAGFTDSAEDAVFDVLNVGQHHVDDEQAAAALERVGTPTRELALGTLVVALQDELADGSLTITDTGREIPTPRPIDAPPPVQS